jgi:outer membrane receptor protein involved in Fe transport
MHLGCGFTAVLCLAATAARAQDAGVPVTDGAADAQPAPDAQTSPPDAGSEAPPAQPMPSADGGTESADLIAGGTEEQVRAAVAGVKDITELSLEDLLRVETTASTKSKPMTLRDSPNVMTLITREEIQRSGARELADVLRLVPGIQMNGDLYSSVYAGFRGVWGIEGKVLVLFDGHEMFELLYYATEMGNRFPVDQIERIEILRGPGTVIYGGTAELAVINIVTRSAEDLEGAALAGVYGQMFDGALHHGQSLADTFGHRTLSAAFGRTFGGPRGLAVKAGIYAGQGNRSDQTYADIYGATYNLTGNARSDPMLLHAAADYRGLHLGYLFEYYRTTMRDGYGQMLADTLPVTYLSSSARATYDWQLGHGLKLVPRVQWLYQQPWRTSGETARLDYPDIYWQPTAQRLLGGLALTWDVLPTLNLLVGGDYYRDSATSAPQPFTDPDDPSQLTQHVSYWNVAAYGQALLETAWVNLSAGARFERRSHVGNSFVPRAGATKTFGPFHFKLLYSRAFRAPAMGDLLSNVDVKPERTKADEIEVGYRLHATLFAALNLYDLTIYQPFTYYYDPSTGLDGYRNYDQMGTRGLECELRWKAERAFANLSYSFYTTRGKSRIATLSVPGRGDVLLGFAPHKLALLGGAGLTRRLDASLSVVLLAGERFGYYAYDVAGVPAGRDYGTELQLGAFVSYRDLLGPGSYVGLGLSNLTNAKTLLIQPYDNGHPPMAGMSREVFVKIGFEQRRQGDGRPAP